MMALLSRVYTKNTLNKRPASVFLSGPESSEDIFPWYVTSFLSAKARAILQYLNHLVFLNMMLPP